ncbi:MAG: transposase [Methanomicrobiaceae archaeon]|nr:transposase [Methanomicrobiaceae archaeon]
METTCPIALYGSITVAVKARAVTVQGNPPGRGRPFWFDPELYKKRSAVERFLCWIEAFKQVVFRYERYEYSFPGFIFLAWAMMVRRVMG